MRKRNEETINILPSLNNFLCIWPGFSEIWPAFPEIWPRLPEIWPRLQYSKREYQSDLQQHTVDSGAKETARLQAALFNLIDSQIN